MEIKITPQQGKEDISQRDSPGWKEVDLVYQQKLRAYKDTLIQSACVGEYDTDEWRNIVEHFIDVTHLRDRSGKVFQIMKGHKVSGFVGMDGYLVSVEITKEE